MESRSLSREAVSTWPHAPKCQSTRQAMWAGFDSDPAILEPRHNQITQTEHFSLEFQPFFPFPLPFPARKQLAWTLSRTSCAYTREHRSRLRYFGAFALALADGVHNA